MFANVDFFVAVSMVKIYGGFPRSSCHCYYCIPYLVPCGVRGPWSYRGFTRIAIEASVSNLINARLKFLSTHYSEPMHL